MAFQRLPRLKHKIKSKETCAVIIKYAYHIVLRRI